jgi:hypothetical protein
MARAAGLPEREVERIKVASLLHDLGNLAIPDEILSKPGELAEPEWRVVAEHPKIGQVVLEQAGALRDAATIVLHHHEWFDGRGYPHGLRGEQIPVGARIVAIADAYEAMVAGRPYRAAIDHRAAIAELRHHAGVSSTRSSSAVHRAVRVGMPFAVAATTTTIRISNRRRLAADAPAERRAKAPGPAGDGGNGDRRRPRQRHRGLTRQETCRPAAAPARAGRRAAAIRGHAASSSPAARSSTGPAPILSADVAIEGERIVAVGPGLDGDAAVDVAGRTLLPGLFDCHVHVAFSHVDIWRLVQQPFSYQFYVAEANLRATLAIGITSVRDAGGADLGMQRAVEDGLIAGPRMQISLSMLSQTGGHGDDWMPSGAHVDWFVPHPGRPATVVDGPEAMRHKVRELMMMGADVIKVATSGGVLSPRRSAMPLPP